MSSISLERIIRPFVIIESRPQQTVAPVPITDLEAIDDISIEWGAPADFLAPRLDRPVVVAPDEPEIGSYDDQIKSLTDQISDFEDRIEELEEQDPDIEEQKYTFTEIGRTVDVVRISNTTEAGLLYVDVERILTITFRAPNGDALTYKLNHKAPAA